MVVGDKRPPIVGVSNFMGYIFNLLLIFLFFVVLYFSFRFFGFSSLNKAHLVSFWNDSVISAFVMGFRYDSKVMTILMLPLVLAGIPLLWLSHTYRKWLNRATVFYTMIIGICLFFIEIINVNYFRFFKNQINVDVFGIIYDDTAALLHSIISDFPIVLLTVFFVVAVVIMYYVVHYFVTRPIFPGKVLSIVVLLVFVPLLLLGARGSFGTFPLQKSDRAVSSNMLVNELVMNGFYALLEAEKEFSKGRYFTDENEILKAQGFSSVEEAISQYGFNVGGNSIDSLFIYQSAKKHEGFKNPNVVVFFMEGMGTSYFWPDDFIPGNLGKFGEQLSVFDVFYKCMPGGNLTVNSIESFVLGTIDGPLCQSKYAKKPFNSSVAFPFERAGYQNMFITGGKLDWRNLGSFMLTQGFHKSVGMEIISKQNREARSNEWGVYDEYLFDYVYNRLVEPGEPKFVFALTTSNHIPYNVPPGHALQNFNSTPFAKVVSSDTTTFNRNLELFYYAANQLGVFMDKLRHSVLAENTIVVVTGDHTIRHNMMFPNEQIHKNFAVPLIMYVPDAYKMNKPVVDRWVSHRDINNTICELALSDVTYFGTGSNIYNSLPENYYAINDKNLAVSDIGISELREGNMYRWLANDWNGELRYAPNDSALVIQQKSVKAYITLLRINQARSMNNYQ